MKKTVSKCFAIVLFTITIFSMIVTLLCATDTLPVFLAFGVLCVALFALSLLGVWVACASILFTATKETIRTGEGLSKLFQIFIGKIAKAP